MSLYSNKGQVITNGQTEINKKQKTVISGALIRCALGFLIMAALSFAFGAIWQATLKNINQWTTTFNIVFIITILLLIVSSIISSIWQTKMIFKKSPVLTGFVWGIYIVANALAFSLLISLFQASLWWMMGVLFASAALLFGLCGLIGWGLSSKAGITLNKIMMIMMAIISSLFMVALILMLLSIFLPALENTVAIFWTIGFVIIFVLIFFSTISTFNNIKTVDQFAQLNADGSDSQKEIVGRLQWIFGFELLCNLTTIVWLLIELLLIFGRRR